VNPAHLHLALNHLPLVGVLVGGLLLAWGLFRDEEPVIRAALGTLLLAGAAAVGVYFTGEPAEELVESLAGVSETALEAHEEAALWAAVGGGALAALALVSLAVGRMRRATRLLAGITLAAAAVVLGVMAWTANLGGEIRHPEIRRGAAVEAPAEGGEAGREAEEHEEASAAGTAPAPAGASSTTPARSAAAG